MQVWVKLLGVCKPVVRSVVSCICTAPVCRLNTSRRSGPIPATVLHFPVPVPNPVVITAVPIPHRLFHARAAVTRKNRSPMVWSRVLGTISRCWEQDRSHRSDSASSVHWRSRRRSAYGGAMLLRQRKTSTASRNCIFSGTRNQWRSRKRCVTWSYFCT